MANTCCFCIGLRPGTIIITALLFIGYLSVPLIYSGKSTLSFDTVHTLKNGMKIWITTVIDVSPHGMDYIFAVFLPVVTLAMLLSAILRKSEILFYAMITYIILLILLIVYSTLGEERGWWIQYKFPSSATPYYFSHDNKVGYMPKSLKSLFTVIGYVIGGYFIFVVYSYVQQLRQAVPTSGRVIRA